MFHLLVGLYTFTNFTIEDSAIHAEMTKIVASQIYPIDYSPIANVKFTYPPLFHYISSMFLVFGSIAAVRIVGFVAFIFFPVCVYLIGTLFNKRIALFSALFAAVISNFTILMIFSAFPQILAFNFYLLFLYFYFKEKYSLSGIFFGLTILTHPFVAVLSFISLILFVLIFKSKNIVKTATVGFLISLFWVYQYFLIFIHAITGSWQNVVHYGNAGLITKAEVIDYLMRLNPAFFLFAIYSFFIFLKSNDKKLRFFSMLFIIVFAFSIYKLAPAQLKFFDALTIPTIMLAAVAVEFAIKNLNSKIFNFTLASVLIISAFFPIMTIYEYNSQHFAINKNEIKAAKWLKSYDDSESRIVFIGEPKTEVVFAALSNKIPMNAIISDLEAYTNEYKKQISDREKIIKGDFGLLQEYEIRYVVGECDFNVIYLDEKLRICRI